ncbi:MAG TPA: glutaredoxin family protein [Candidatus Nanopelagicaceae bacterium]|nr:glutaredoxin family protein [Candidatus Nanopelagicaceae bacterium]
MFVVPDALQLLGRRGCHLCEVVRPTLAEFCAQMGVPLVELDVDEDPGLWSTYSERVPVVLWRGMVIAEGRFDPRAIAESVAHGRHAR